MSGGAFEYRDSAIEEVASGIDLMVKQNGKVVDGWQRPKWSPKTIQRMEKVARILHLAGKAAHEIDWMASGDTGEDTFNEVWDKEINL